MSPGINDVCDIILKAMRSGRAIPFLGAGASLPGRPEDDDFDWHREGFLPSGAELARFLAREYRYPPQNVEPNRSLVRIAQFADLWDSGLLFEDLRTTFTVAQEPNEVHHYLARQLGVQQRMGLPNPWPVIVTTNYDDRLETAFEQAGAPFDLVTYNGDWSDGSPFRHRDPDGHWRRITPTYDAFEPARRPVILKLHGGIAARGEDPEHFVITEDHYISYLAHDVVQRLPSSLLGLMRDANFVFLGYRLEDWNVRVLLSRIGTPHPRRRWWAIQRSPSLVDERFWASHKVDIVETTLESWIETMRRRWRAHRRADP